MAKLETERSLSLPFLFTPEQEMEILFGVSRTTAEDGQDPKPNSYGKPLYEIEHDSSKT